VVGFDLCLERLECRIDGVVARAWGDDVVGVGIGGVLAASLQQHVVPVLLLDYLLGYRVLGEVVQVATRNDLQSNVYLFAALDGEPLEDAGKVIVLEVGAADEEDQEVIGPGACRLVGAAGGGREREQCH